MKFTSDTDPSFAVEVNGYPLFNLANALEAERVKHKRTIPLRLYVGDDGSRFVIGWKNHCFQVNSLAS